jgi:GNAT superfamily N-acetyltransferase
VDDPRDDEVSSRHYGGFLGERLVVSASFFLAPAPVNLELTSYQLRYMATDVDVQGRGYGAETLRYAVREFRSMGVAQLWAYARDSALGFYRRVGWSILEGSEHLSTETQLPHTVIFMILGEN